MESIVDILSQGRDREAQSSKIYGLVVGIVTNNQDPDKLCRVKVKFPWLAEDVESWWCRIAYPMAGLGRGTMIIPEVDDEVLVGFEHGDVRFPYIVGSLYNGVDTPPTANDITGGFGGTGYDHGSYGVKDVNEDGNNDIRFFKSRSGHLMIFDDKSGAEKITVCDNTGKHRIEIFTADKRVVITNEDGDMEFITKNTMLMRCEDLVIEARSSGTMEFGTTLDVTSGGNMTLKTDANYKAEAASKYDTKSGMNMTHKAGMNFTAEASMNATMKASLNATVEGSVNAELKGSAMTTVKGGVVMIN